MIGDQPRNRGLMICIRSVSQLDAAVVSGRVCREDLKAWAMFYSPLSITQQGAMDAFLSMLDLKTWGVHHGCQVNQQLDQPATTSNSCALKASVLTGRFPESSSEKFHIQVLDTSVINLLEAFSEGYIVLSNLGTRGTLQGSYIPICPLRLPRLP